MDHHDLDIAGIEVPEDAVEMVFFCADGYDVSIPITDLDTPMWLVWEMNGEPLFPAHGPPFRFLVPGRYGTKNPKWVERFEFSPIPHEGYWERRGWSNDATYKPNALTLSPSAYAVFGEGGAIRVQGSAFAGLDPVTLVEWTEDDGANLRLGRMIRARGIATYVPAGGSVRSGGVELFLAGARRFADPDAEFAVHA